MNEVLKVLERLVYAITHDVNAYSQYTQSQPFIDQDKALVEKALKEGEKAQFKLKALGNFVKKSKALEIIKETFKITFYDENPTIGIDDTCFITFKDKAKYDLLKEELL